MNIKINLFLLQFLLFVYSFSQSTDIKRTHHWYFGENAGIDFSSGTAVVDTNGKINTLEGCATISDIHGNLLFYTDGKKVWDSTHTLMPNGYGLHGDWSSQNSAVIVPNPSHENIYYLFTTPAYAGNSSGFKALEYSIVDMSLNGGLGDLTSKNISLIPISTEQLGVVHHQNKVDFWVVGHEDGSNNFLSFLVTANGVSHIPVISSIGKNIDPFSSTCCYDAVSGLKFATSGCRMAVTYPNSDTVQIFDFDNNSGSVMNPLTLNIPNPWSSCFSPNNKLLYVGTMEHLYGEERFFQYDLSSNNSSDIINTESLITSSISFTTTMQIAPDGKIYCTDYQNQYLSIINNPNGIGLSCDFELNGFYLGGKLSLYGLPNFVQSYFDNDVEDLYCSTIGISELIKDEIFTVVPNPFSSGTVIQTSEYFNDLTLQIFNSNGILVYQIDKLYGDKISLNRDHLTKGIYYVNLVESKVPIKTLKIAVMD